RGTRNSKWIDRWSRGSSVPYPAVYRWNRDAAAAYAPGPHPTAPLSFLTRPESPRARPVVLAPALLPVVAHAAPWERAAQQEVALRGVVAGDAGVDLLHPIGVVVDGPGDRVGEVVGHLARHRDGGAHGGRHHRLVAVGRLGIGAGRDHALAHPELAEELE